MTMFKHLLGRLAIRCGIDARRGSGAGYAVLPWAARGSSWIRR